MSLDTFYQPIDFTCSHSVTPVKLKNAKLNQYIAMFLCTLIRLERYRWTYGRKWRPIRMPKSQIKLPVTPQGKPDWQFMENYIKSLPYTKNLKSVKNTEADFQLPNSFEQLLKKSMQPFEQDFKSYLC